MDCGNYIFEPGQTISGTAFLNSSYSPPHQCIHPSCAICAEQQKAQGRMALEYAKQRNEKKADYKQRCGDYMKRFRARTEERAAESAKNGENVPYPPPVVSYPPALSSAGV